MVGSSPAIAIIKVWWYKNCLDTSKLSLKDNVRLFPSGSPRKVWRCPSLASKLSLQTQGYPKDNFHQRDFGRLDRTSDLGTLRSGSTSISVGFLLFRTLAVTGHRAVKCSSSGAIEHPRRFIVHNVESMLISYLMVIHHLFMAKLMVVHWNGSNITLFCLSNFYRSTATIQNPLCESHSFEGSPTTSLTDLAIPPTPNRSIRGDGHPMIFGLPLLILSFNMRAMSSSRAGGARFQAKRVIYIFNI